MGILSTMLVGSFFDVGVLNKLIIFIMDMIGSVFLLGLSFRSGKNFFHKFWGVGDQVQYKIQVLASSLVGLLSMVILSLLVVYRVLLGREWMTFLFDKNHMVLGFSLGLFIVLKYISSMSIAYLASLLDWIRVSRKEVKDDFEEIPLVIYILFAGGLSLITMKLGQAFPRIVNLFVVDGEFTMGKAYGIEVVILNTRSQIGYNYTYLLMLALISGLVFLLVYGLEARIKKKKEVE